jgi:hypothetical protein
MFAFQSLLFCSLLACLKDLFPHLHVSQVGHLPLQAGTECLEYNIGKPF